jgi:hypothetical protein
MATLSQPVFKALFGQTQAGISDTGLLETQLPSPFFDEQRQ